MNKVEVGLSASAAPSPVPTPTDVDITPGPALLEGIADGHTLAAHRRQYGEIPRFTLEALSAMIETVALRGRGGAAFPFARKLSAAAAGRRPVVVVNLAEGEPASAKDSALALTRPHLILDGAVAAARALRARELHVVLPGDRRLVGEAMRLALAERDDALAVVQHEADSRFVAGQARAVIELMSGRPNLPVTAWTPEAVKGYRGRPTLLSNAETWAQVGRLVLRGPTAYRRHGLQAEPGTTLLTLASTRDQPRVIEVEYGTRLRDVLPLERQGRPLLVGGFHGSWATWPTVSNASVSVERMIALGIPLGAGVLLSTAGHECPVALTSRIVDHLAGQSAGRCGPCFNGLPALAAGVRAVHDGYGGTERLDQLSAVLVRRGACAHPDGTVRLVRSLLAAFPADVAAHASGRPERCEWTVAS
ncbi:NADH-ubiquinone oxidoreductase-F iron-sulfur binding region domain-containing protein [Nocardioides sp.]|uniref:NADH-ubiquinone oxidoreductase-F iron-sulfur binding region domain-containing protein n=1 Tax=Nocardioides sp. TaxID=35761 RepID=UPI003D0A6ECC